MQFLEITNHIYNQFIKYETTYLLSNKVIHGYSVFYTITC